MPKYAPLEPGDPTSLGSYEVVGRLGAGGQGAVYLGKSAATDWVAIKFLHAQMNADPQARARFVREVAAAKKVRPFCTARIIEADVDSDKPYVVSEFIDGPSLHDLVAQQGPRPETELRHLAIGMLTALAAIHEEGIVHRDFKPNNVLIADDGPRVVDFGIARTVNSQESAVTATGMVVGTPGYLAPEQLTGAPLQSTVDIFAFGATMVFAATGQSPFEAETLPVIINRILNDDPDLSGLPESLRPVIARCLAKDMAQRPAAIDALTDLMPSLRDLRGRGGQGASTDEVLQQGTQIASQLPTPPARPTPAPQAFASPAQPPAPAQGSPYASHAQQAPQPFAPPSTPPPQQYQQQPFQQQPNFQPPTPPPFQPQAGGTPPPFQQSGFHQPGMAHPQQPQPYPQTPPPFQGTPPPFQPTPPPFQGGPPFQPGPPPGPGFAQPQPHRSSNNGLYAIGCAVLAIIAIVLLVVIVAANSGDKKKDDDTGPISQPTAQPTTRPSQETSQNSGACANTSTTGGFPCSFAGNWEGTITQKEPKPETLTVSLTIREGATTGSITYTNASGGKCTGSLRWIKNSPAAEFLGIVEDRVDAASSSSGCTGVQYDLLFPTLDRKRMFFFIFKTQTAAETTNYNSENKAIGTLKKQ